MIVTLDQPPLAAAHYARTMLGGLATGQLNVHSSSSLAYLASLDRLQAAAAGRLHRAIPQATVGRPLKIILDGLTVTLPLRQLPKLYKLGLAKRVYPSARFTMNLDDSPSLIGATAFINRTGANGEGMKIAVVDDGIDQTSTFFDAKGYQLPRRLPARAEGLHHAEGDRRPRLSRAPAPGRPASYRSTARPRSTARTSPGSPQATGDDRAGRPRPPRGQGPHWRRAARVARQLPGLQRADAGRQQRLHAADRRRVRGRGRRRDGRDQLLRRRADERPRERRARRGRAQRRRRGRRPRDLGRQRPRRLRARLGRRARHGAGRDQRRRRLEHACLRPRR